MALWTLADLALDASDAWYDTGDTATITSATNQVSAVADKKNTRHLDQSTAAERPDTGVRTVNALNVIDFTAANNDHLVGATTPALFADAANPFHVVVVFVVDAAGAIISQNITNSGTGQQFNLFASTDGSVKLLARGGSTVLGTWTAGAATMVSIKWDGTSGTVIHAAATTAMTVGTAAQEANAITKLGARSNTTTTSEFQFLDGAIGEAFITGRVLSAEDKDKVEGYMAHRWAVTADLPADHTYKSTAPSTGTDVTATIDHGFLLDNSGTVELEVTAAVDHGLTLDNSGTVEATVTATVDHGLVLDNSGAAEATVTATVDHGLVLGNSGAAGAEVTASIDHGLVFDSEGSVTIKPKQGNLRRNPLRRSTSRPFPRSRYSPW